MNREMDIKGFVLTIEDHIGRSYMDALYRSKSRPMKVLENCDAWLSSKHCAPATIAALFIRKAPPDALLNSFIPLRGTSVVHAVVTVHADRIGAQCTNYKTGETVIFGPWRPPKDSPRKDWCTQCMSGLRLLGSS